MTRLLHPSKHRWRGVTTLIIAGISCEDTSYRRGGNALDDRVRCVHVGWVSLLSCELPGRRTLWRVDGSTGVLVGGLIVGGSLVAAPTNVESALGALSPSLVSQLLSATSGRMPAMVHGATLAGRWQGGVEERVPKRVQHRHPLFQGLRTGRH